MKILIIGADGQLGTDLCKVIPKGEQIPLTIKDIDITNKDNTFEVIKKHSPDVVINTAAYHRVDDCEDNQDLAFRVNDTGAGNVAEACRAIDAALVHISTDYVFRGDKNTPYTEEDTPDPQSVYGRSKLAGEQRVQRTLMKYYIVRSAGLYGVAGCLGKGGGNFVETIIKKAEAGKQLLVVSDEYVSPTYTYDLAGKIYQLIRTEKYGLYHIVNHGYCSWYQFADEILMLLRSDVPIVSVTAKDFVNKPEQPKAHRPKYSVLANANLKKIGLDDLRDWQNALQAYLAEKRSL
jgi:dTDP-4-dehydrorhamnose reductase